MEPNDPLFRPEPVEDRRFGLTVPDPYRRLEDGKDPETVSWTAVQRLATERYLAGYPQREDIRRRLEILERYDAVSAPGVHGGRFFYNKCVAGGEFKEGFWREETGGAERLLLDPSDWNPDGTLTLGSWIASRDGRHVVAKIHPHNSDRAFLRIFNVDTGRPLPDGDIAGARLAHPQWTEDSGGFFYVGLPEDCASNRRMTR